MEQDLINLRDKCKAASLAKQRLEGEKVQLDLERSNLQKKLEEAGFKTLDELTTKLDVLKVEANVLKSDLEKVLINV